MSRGRSCNGSTSVVRTINERDVVLIEAERTTQDHVKTKRVTCELQQTWKRPALNDTTQLNISSTRRWRNVMQQCLTDQFNSIQLSVLIC